MLNVFLNQKLIVHSGSAHKWIKSRSITAVRTNKYRINIRWPNVVLKNVRKIVFKKGTDSTKSEQLNYPGLPLSRRADAAKKQIRSDRFLGFAKTGAMPSKRWNREVGARRTIKPTAPKVCVWFIWNCVFVYTINKTRSKRIRFGTIPQTFWNVSTRTTIADGWTAKTCRQFACSSATRVWRAPSRMWRWE